MEINHVWTSTGSSGGIANPFGQNDCGVLNTVLYCQSSTLASTQSFSLQTALASTGPWFTEGSTSISATANAGSLDALRLTGPWLYLRPYLNHSSTGTFTFRLVGVR